MSLTNNEGRTTRRRSTGSWDLDVSLQILDASFADFNRNGTARGAVQKREPRPQVTRYELHGRSPATQHSHGSTWSSHPMPEQAARAYLAEKRAKGTNNEYKLKPVTVEEPIERSIVRWTPKHPTKGINEEGQIGPMSAQAAEYYMRDIPAARKQLFNFEIIKTDN